jgi:hypothetical protein
MKAAFGLFLRTALYSLILCGPVFANAADATDAVRAWLSKHDIKEGYDAKRERFVFVDDCQRELASLEGSDFFRTREQMSLAAIFSAKRELIEFIESGVSVVDSVELRSDGDETVQTTKSIVDIFSKRILHGCTVLDVEESHEDGVYQVAVAVAWSEKLEQAACAALAGNGPKTTPEQDEAEWSAWAERTDFARRIGPAQFTDSHGVYRYAGVGCVDVEGKKGKEMLAAKKAAEEKAKQALVYSLWADTVAHDHAVTVLRERSASDGDTSEATEDFVSRVSQACKRAVMKKDVFKGKVVHPLTGRTMFVHVAGIDPATLAEQKVLEEERK